MGENLHICAYVNLQKNKELVAFYPIFQFLTFLTSKINLHSFGRSWTASSLTKSSFGHPKRNTVGQSVVAVQSLAFLTLNPHSNLTGVKITRSKAHEDPSKRSRLMLILFSSLFLQIMDKVPLVAILTSPHHHQTHPRPRIHSTFS